jgi:transcriptional regulator with XRE-family HTH domain
MSTSTRDAIDRHQLGALRTWLASGVRRRRRDQRWTQRDLARRAGVNHALVNRLERGGNISVETFGRIASALAWDACQDLIDGPPAIVEVRMLLIRRLRGVAGRLGRLLITLEEAEEEDDHASA